MDLPITCVFTKKFALGPLRNNCPANYLSRQFLISWPEYANYSCPLVMINFQLTLKNSKCNKYTQWVEPSHTTSETHQQYRKTLSNLRVADVYFASLTHFTRIFFASIFILASNVTNCKVFDIHYLTVSCVTG